MYERTAQDFQEAQAHAQRVVAEAGLTVMHGEEPTPGQVALAALHGREDAALNAFLLGKVLQRLEEQRTGPIQFYRLGVVFWWAGLITAIPTLGLATLLLFWPLSYVLTGSYLKPPPRIPRAF